MYVYIRFKCNNISDNNSFWKAVKPIVSDNVKCVKDIVLSQGSSIINDHSNVCQEFNNFLIR